MKLKQEETIQPIIWFDKGDVDGQYAIVGNMVIADFFMPSIEKLKRKKKRKYHVRTTGLSYNNHLLYTGDLFGNKEDAREFVEKWWNNIINHITTKTPFDR